MGEHDSQSCIDTSFFTYDHVFLSGELDFSVEVYLLLLLKVLGKLNYNDSQGIGFFSPFQEFKVNGFPPWRLWDGVFQ